MTLDIDTPHGPARAHFHASKGATSAVVLGHGAGGGVNAPDLVAARRAAQALGLTVVLIEQPYRVAGRRSPAPAQQLDTAWLAVLEQLDLDGLELITGGRSSGARVACRTAAQAGAAAVICLAFPVHPPGRPEKSRLDELDAVTVPVLVVQGSRDPFGMPPSAANRTIVEVAGDHSLRAGAKAVEAAVGEWLRNRAASPGRPRDRSRRSARSTR
jgi:predicted alpha/beta-hydrolase family hydrolase